MDTAAKKQNRDSTSTRRRCLLCRGAAEVQTLFVDGGVPRAVYWLCRECMGAGMLSQAVRDEVERRVRIMLAQQANRN